LELIYRKIARSLEDDILTGVIRADEPVPSTNRYAEVFRVNPATAAKGVALLTAEGVLYKKRGVGMFVTAAARDIILERRRSEFRDEALPVLMDEAQRLGVSRQDLIAMILSVNL
jgi:DNA-binding transcriptional regulator YhcF (GntR family)